MYGKKSWNFVVLSACVIFLGTPRNSKMKLHDVKAKQKNYTMWRFFPIQMLTTKNITHTDNKKEQTTRADNTEKNYTRQQQKKNAYTVKSNLQGLPPLLILLIVGVVDSHNLVWPLELGW